MGTKLAIIKRLQEIQVLIIKADSAELNKLGVELAEIEKKLLNYTNHCGEIVERK